MSKTFSIGGVHPHDSKFAKDCPIEDLPLPKKAYVAMNQHIGAPAQPVVNKGDRVIVGQLIGKSGGFVSASIHAPFSGTVADVALYPDFTGRKVMTVVIDVEGDEWMPEIDTTPDIKRAITVSPQETLKIIADSGVVGLGGASFPTHVKLSPPPGQKASVLILNGTECEPFLTSDYRLMLEHGEEVLLGGELMRRVLGEPRGVIGIEENKPEAIAVMRKLVEHYLGWEVMTLKKRYPQGGEKQLIDAVTSRKVPSMALPIAAGAVVQNVGTAFAVYEAVQKHKPLFTNIMTVTGPDSSIQRNFRFRMGTRISDILLHAGVIKPESGLIPEVAKVVNGGPMMGRAVSNLEAPMQKSSSALLLLPAEVTRRKEPGNCIRCGKCVQACPMGLEPYLLYRLALASRQDELMEHYVYDCIECGCCMYSCPASLPLLDQIRLARASALKNKRK